MASAPRLPLAPRSAAGPLAAARLRPRLAAFAVHGALTAAALAPIAHLTANVWYPDPYFDVDGGRQGLVLLVAVVAVAGPVLTLMVFDVAKSRGKNAFDLVVIALAQAVAIAIGAHTLEAERPAAVVLAEGRFLPVTARALAAQRADLAALEAMHDARPPLLYSLPPRDRNDLGRMFLRVLNEGWAPFELASRMRPLAPHPAALARARVDPGAAAREGPGVGAWIARLRAAGAAPSLYRFEGRYGSALLALGPGGALLGSIVVP